MFLLSNLISPWTRSGNVVTPSGTRSRIARGVPAASSRATSSVERRRQVRSYIHPPPAASAACRFGFSRANAEGLNLPGPVELERFLGLELEANALKTAEGLVSAAVGGKAREVLVKKDYFDEVDAQLR